MPDNDNDRFSDSERRLIEFMHYIRPESKILMNQLDSISNWLWVGKMSALGCFLIVSGLAVLSDFQWWQVAIVLAAAVAPIYMIERLELLFGRRWKSSLKFRRRVPSIVWNFHQIKPFA